MKIIGPDGKSLDDILREATYVHHQDVASVTWTITHPLQKRPAVMLVDSADKVFQADIQYISDIKIVITLAAATTGKAYLN